MSLAGFLQYAYTGAPASTSRSTSRPAPTPRWPSRHPERQPALPGQTSDDRKAADANLALAYRDFGANLRMKREDAGGYVGVLDVLGDQNRLTNTQMSLAGHWGRTLRAGDAGATGRVQPERARALPRRAAPGFTLLPADRVQVVFPGGGRLPGPPGHAAGRRRGHARPRW